MATILPEQPKSRQELYDRIRQTSKDEVVLAEMIRLGFWPEGRAAADDPADELRRRGELERELSSLLAEHARVRDQAELARELRRARMAEAKARREATKERRKAERAARAEEWRKKKAEGIVWLGEEVSGGLQERKGDEAKLAKNGLPLLHDAAAIASALGISVGQLRFLAFDRRVASVSHYRTFKLPKRSGGERTISAPLPRLKAAQRWILANVLEKVPVHAASHGFRRGRSIVTNALPHVAPAIVVNVDLRDFFPSVTYPRVKGLFRWLGYSEAAATILALLSTARDAREVELDGRVWYVGTGPRRLPQGAPTSPALTNVLCGKVDRRLSSAAGKLGFAYTRYADDLTFSTKDAAADVGKLLRQVEWLVEQDGFELHPDKTRVQRRGRRQEVTGVVVNERPSIARDTLRRFRATLFQIEKDGPAGKRWGTSGNVMASIAGFADYVAMVDPKKGAALKARVKAIHAKHGWVPARRPPPVPPPPPVGEKPKKPWWRFW